MTDGPQNWRFTPTSLVAATGKSPLRTIMAGCLDQVYQAQEEILKKLPPEQWPNRFEVTSEWNDGRPRIIVEPVWGANP